MAIFEQASHPFAEMLGLEAWPRPRPRVCGLGLEWNEAKAEAKAEAQSGLIVRPNRAKMSNSLLESLVFLKCNLAL